MWLSGIMFMKYPQGHRFSFQGKYPEKGKEPARGEQGHRKAIRDEDRMRIKYKDKYEKATLRLFTLSAKSIF